MPRIIRDDGARLTYEIQPPAGTSSPLPFLFQHGMGGERRQPLGYLAAPLPGTDLVCMDARGHGDSSDIADVARCSFDAFGDDVIALADHLGAEHVVMGGISLGAAVSVNVAACFPERVAALVLCRPAWLDSPQAERNRGAYRQIADLLDTQDVEPALAVFTHGALYREVEIESASAAQSLRHQITRPRAAINAEILRRFPGSAPAATLDAWRRITAPTLVIGHRDDPFHPWSIAEATTAAIPTARLIEVASKDRGPNRFATEIDAAIRDFLGQVAPARS
jgi:pimeloyl-ACP methyl ester carboxylesterase